jgi:hypothetical protein
MKSAISRSRSSWWYGPIIRSITRAAIGLLYSTVGFNDAFAQACIVRLKHPVPYSCPAVTYGPDDCTDESWGKAGDLVTSPAAVMLMKSGYSYYCPSHESCIQLKDLEFRGCILTYVSRGKNDSEEYEGYIFVGDAEWSRKIGH